MCLVLSPPVIYKLDLEMYMLELYLLLQHGWNQGDCAKQSDEEQKLLDIFTFMWKINNQKMISKAQ